MRSWSLDDIVDADTAPIETDTRSGPVVLGRPDPVRRRTVLRGITLSAATLGWLAVGWTLPSAQRKAYADSGPAGLKGWDNTHCTDAYPTGYPEQYPTDGSGYPAACWGSSLMGPTWCGKDKWVRRDTVTLPNGHDYYMADPTSCSGRNAWKWTASDGHVYRCSDGEYSFDRDGGARQGPYFIVCQARL